MTSATFLPPPDGIVDGADLAVLLGAWTTSPPANPSPCGVNCCSDFVTSATFAPPPDGIVDGADLAVLLGAWGDPCLLPGEPEPESFTSDGNPLDDETLGPLLEAAMENDDEAAAEALALLLEMLGS